MKMKKKKLLLCLSFSFALLWSCQTTNKPQKNNLTSISNSVNDKDISSQENLQDISFKKLYIELFSNQNFEAGLNARLRQKLIHKYSMDGRMSIQKSRADADMILSGTIASFGLVPIAYDPRHEVTRYQLSISVSFFLNTNPQKDTSNGQQKFLQAVIEGERGSNYKMIYSSHSRGLSSLEMLKDQLLEGLSYRIVRASLDNWYPRK